MDFLSSSEALTFMRSNRYAGVEYNINGKIFFGMDGEYVWRDIALATGIEKIDIVSPTLRVYSPCFHHFDWLLGADEIVRCLDYIHAADGFLSSFPR